MINYTFLAQLCCILAIFVWNISVQNKKMDKILYFQFLSNLLYGMSYLLLGARLAAIMNFIGCSRCLLFYYKHKQGEKIGLHWLFIFCLLIVISGILNYEGPISLIPPIITFFYTVSSWAKEANWLRIVFLFAAFLWLYYNTTVEAYVAVVGNFFEITSGIISIYRFNRKKENKTS